MVLNYKHVVGSQPEKPLEVDETSSKYSVYLRKNIVSKEVTDNNITSTFWEYDEAILTKEEYDEYKKEIDEDKLAELIKSNKELRESNDLLAHCVMELGQMVYK